MLKLVVLVGACVVLGCFAEEGARERRSAGYDDDRGYDHEDSYGRDDKHEDFGGYEKDYYKKSKSKRQKLNARISLFEN